MARKGETRRKLPQLQRGRSPRGEVRRGANGKVEMITFNKFRDNPGAPIITVHDVGAVYLIGNDSLQVTMINKMRNAAGDLDWQAAAHLMWEERDWLRTGECFRWLMTTWKAGKIVDGHVRRITGGH